MEIGQPTFVELIYTESRRGRTFAPSSATVENSLRRLAFKKQQPYRDVEPQTSPVVVAVPQRQHVVYPIGRAGTASTLRAQRLANEFRSFTSSPAKQSLQDVIRKQSDEPIVVAPFNSVYSVYDMGRPPDTPTRYGGMAFKNGDNATLVLGGYANDTNGILAEIPVSRDGDDHPTATGEIVRTISAPYVDGGVAYHPSGVLFVCAYPQNLLYQYLPGATSPSKTINLQANGVVASVGSIGFVPVGYPGAGKVRLITYPSGAGYDLELIPDGNGTFNLASVTLLGHLLHGPEGFVYVPLGSELFPNPSMLVTEYNTGNVVAYELDGNGWAVPASRRIMVTGLALAEGAAIDPLTGDFIFTTYGGSDHLYRVWGGFNPPAGGSDLPACNILYNGDFLSGVSGWTVIGQVGDDFISWDSINGRLDCQESVQFYQSVPGPSNANHPTPGKLVRVTFTIHWGTVTAPEVGVGQPVPPAPPSDASWSVRSVVKAVSISGTPQGPEFSITGQQGTSQTVTYDTVVQTPPSGILVLIFSNDAYSATVGDQEIIYHSPVQFDNISVCEIDSNPCVGTITNVRSKVQFQGIPRKPVNLFNMVARLTFRDPADPSEKTITDLLATSDGRTGVVVPSNCANADTCDFWKQQGNGGVAASAVTSTGVGLTANAVRGALVDVTTKNNWLWSIPGSTNGSQQDSLVSVWPDSDAGLLESVEFLFLAQVVTNSGAEITPNCAGPFNCADDPAGSLTLKFQYTNRSGLTREFSQDFGLGDLYQASAAYSDSPDKWDTSTSLGKGVKGTVARWESAKFVLDSTSGSGLDQCTAATDFEAIGAGTLTLHSPSTNKSRGSVIGECDATINIVKIADGAAVNEVQTIILPAPSAGSWTLTFRRNRQTETIPLPWDVNAPVLLSRLEAMNLIGAGNVRVTGTGTFNNPFRIEFVGTLSGTGFRPMIADGSDLKGAASAFVTELTPGTVNERQTITRTSGTAKLVLDFNGKSSIQIPHNASLNTMKNAIEGIDGIGAGAVEVTGNTIDPDVTYDGPWHVDFVGHFTGQSVVELSTASPGYEIMTNWQGGSGSNAVQKITVAASGGTFRLGLFDPLNPTSSVYTAPISHDAGVAQVRDKILAAFATDLWLEEDDIKVLRMPKVAGQPDLYEWTVEFTGQWAKIAIPIMDIDGSNLRGATIVIAEEANGGGAGERQRVNVLRAKSGSYRLRVTIDGEPADTTLIPWDASAEGISISLLALPFFTDPADVQVFDQPPGDPNVVANYVVIFAKRFGNVPLMGFQNNLSCIPLDLATVGPPPYDYTPPECSDDLSVFCSPNPLFCRPSDGGESVELVPCCEQETIRDSANVYRELVLQRELFDPNMREGLTVRDLATLKGLRPSLYHAYLRDFKTGKLRPIAITTPVETKMSVVLIEAASDTKSTRDRIAGKLQNGPGILPSRMVW